MVRDGVEVEAKRDDFHVLIGPPVRAIGWPLVVARR